MNKDAKRHMRLRVQSRNAPRSSHPEAEVGLVPSEAAIDAPTQDDFRDERVRRKAIVSIHGRDVEEDKAA